MYEVEIKAKVKDPDVIRRKLLSAKYLGKRIEIDEYFNFDCEGGCCRDFSVTDEAVRLRKSDGKCVLTYKGPRLDPSAKVREEIEVELNSCDAIRQILEKLCLKSVFVVEKTRERWKWEDITIAIDNVKGLGWFIELEKVVSSNEELENAKNELLLKLREIVPDAEVVSKTYLELLIEKISDR
ncbi:hypothetical protein EYM_03605 [Ignicoccus islandicus DSM 13165]|uniref:CYTH domain-containing protein n=1 Tax=Ignicoccus islandicus DSM 13165 TaxID=940295 RepID=A0A0U3DW30_9CREN|nr:class IV adenylate cyclase [Ignicoccus islandicus]ALU11674.1 hypothetical protein EYM_03605 [Ignicoccus islandicus DSM 13165]